MERTAHAVNSELNLSNPHLEGSRSSYEDDIPLGTANEGIHFASIVEKRRLWWRNAIINTLFIASWCVYNLETTSWTERILQVSLCHSSLCV